MVNLPFKLLLNLVIPWLSGHIGHLGGDMCKIRQSREEKGNAIERKGKGERAMACSSQGVALLYLPESRV